MAKLRELDKDNIQVNNKPIKCIYLNNKEILRIDCNNTIMYRAYVTTVCSTCHGSGTITTYSFLPCSACNGTKNKRCSTCNGTGTIPCNVCRGSGYIDNANGHPSTYGTDGAVPCYECGGEGKIGCAACGAIGYLDGVTCPVCQGTGQSTNLTPHTSTCSNCHGACTVESLPV